MKTARISRHVVAAVLVLAPLIALWLTFARSVEAAATGSIAGTIVNKTTNQPLTGAEVTLYRFEHDPPDQTGQFTTQTGQDGSYAFTDVDASEGIVYVASVTYANVLYSGGMIQLWKQPQQRFDLAVFDTTTDQSALRLQSRGIVVTSVDRDAGTISVLDVFAFKLDDPHTIVAGDDGRTLRFSVPVNAAQVSPLAGYDFGTPSIEGSTIYATSPVTPGAPNATLGYTIPYDGSSLALDVAALYPTDSVRVLLPVPADVGGSQLAVAGDGFQDGGEVSVGDRNYHLWTLPAVAAESRISFTIRGLPSLNAEHNELQTLPPIFVAIIAFLTASTVTAWLIVKRGLYRPRPVALMPALAVPLDQRRDELALELRAVEAAFQDGELDSSAYTTERRAILEELRWLSRQARGLGADE